MSDKRISTDGPNISASADDLMEIGSALAKGGRLDLAEEFLNLAVTAEKTPGGLNLRLPGFPAVQNGPLFDGGSALIKSLAINSMLPDPTPHRINETLYQLGAYTGIKDPGSATAQTFAFLEAVSRFPIIAGIIRTRQNQARRFAKRPVHGMDTGARVAMRDPRQTATRGARKRIEEIENVVFNGGILYLPNGEKRKHDITGQPGVWDGLQEERAMPFGDFLATMVRQSLSMDWAPFRIEPAKDSDAFPVTFFTPVEAKRIRRTIWKYYKPQIDKSGRPVEFVELEPGGTGYVMREYPWDRMGVVVRNPRVDFFGIGYGQCETEDALDIIAAMILGLKFQREYFDNNHIPPAIVSMQGVTQMSEQAIQALRQQIAGAGGPGAFWKLLYMMFQPGTSKPIDVIPLRSAVQGTSEMQFVMQYEVALLNILCSVFQIDAEEIGFKSFTAPGGGTSIGNAPDPESRLRYSIEKGLKPILEAIKAGINEYIVHRIDEDFEWAWVNLDPNDMERDQQRAQARLALGDTPNDVRDEQDRPIRKRPIDPVMWNELAEKHPETEKFPTNDDWRAMVNEKYVKEFTAKYGEDIQPWSAMWDMPVGNPEMVQGMMAERAAAGIGQNQQAMQAQGLDPNAPGMAPDPNTAAPDPNMMQGMADGQQNGFDESQAGQPDAPGGAVRLQRPGGKPPGQAMQATQPNQPNDWGGLSKGVDVEKPRRFVVRIEREQ